MELYRAIPSRNLGAASMNIARQITARIPTNVPYIVDNLWEWLRPQGMPSRRHAVYASPSVELALANASAPLAEGERYSICRVLVESSLIKIAQLNVRDAREHPDIRLIGQCVRKHGRALSLLNLETKQLVAPLFMPGGGKN